MNHDRKWAALAVLAAGLSLIVLDGTIVGVALPAIIADLRLDLTDAQWVNSLYSVVFAALLLTFGRLGDRFGRRSLFLAGVTVFDVYEGKGIDPVRAARARARRPRRTSTAA